ncbi:MAG: hypothetical protein OJF62_001299 [Pseudolabrys sp.]|nr:hypothetical protein [Pseudolabrys sp.]
MRPNKALMAFCVFAGAGLSTTAIAAGRTTLDPNQLHLDPSQLQIGTGVICDTQDEVTDFVKLMGENDARRAMQDVNRAAANPAACGMATVAFAPAQDIGEVHTTKGAFKIMKIEVVAGTANGGWRMIAPTRTQYTAVAVKGLDI